MIIEELILLLNNQLKHDLKNKFTEYTCNNGEDFDSDLICNRCKIGFELDIAENINYYHNKYDNKVSFDFTSVELFNIGNHKDAENDCMNFTCNELIIKAILE